MIATVQQQPATAKRHLAAVEWLEQLTQVMTTVQPKLAAAVQLLAAEEWLE